MKQDENKRAPSSSGWGIAAVAGLAAAAIAYFVAHLGMSQSGFIGLAVFLLLGLILGASWGAGQAETEAAQPVDAVPQPVETPAVPTAPVPAAPVAAAVATMPVATPAPASVSGPAAMFTTAPQSDAAPAKPVRAAKPKAEKAAAKPAAKAAAKPAAAKAAKAPKAAKPAGLVRLTGPRKGKADDLKEIEGIGPVLEKLCHSLGFYHFDQIAGWSDADVALVDLEMKTFKGRITRDRWVPQAKIIVTEGLEAFRIRAQTNNY